MTAEKIVHPDMDVYAEPIAAVAAMNLHDAAEYRIAEVKRAHPHYKRIGHLDEVAGKLTPYTADELADLAFDRKWRRRMFTLYGVLVLAAVVAVVLALHGDGWLR